MQAMSKTGLDALVFRCLYLAQVGPKGPTTALETRHSLAQAGPKGPATTSRSDSSDLWKITSCCEAFSKDFLGGPRAPLIHVFLHGPAHVIYHGFRFHLRSFPLKVLFKPSGKTHRFPSPQFCDPQLAPQLGIIWALDPNPYIPGF